MRKIILVVLLIAALFAGAFVLSQTVFKQDKQQIDSFMLYQKNDDGSVGMSVVIERRGDKALLDIRTAATGVLYSEETDAGVLDSASDLAKNLKLDTWDSFSGDVGNEPGAGCYVVIKYADGSQIAASAAGLGSDVTQRIVGAISDWIADLISGKTGNNSGLFDFFSLFGKLFE